MTSEPIRFDADSGAYVDCRVKRGFPLGGIGAGQVCLNSDGSFGELRSNNNWMCPVRGLRGSFFAVHAARGDERKTVVLRRPPATARRAEYAGAQQRRLDDLRRHAAVVLAALPPRSAVRSRARRLHAARAARSARARPCRSAVFRFRLENPVDEPRSTAAVLFSFENVLGRGGTGNLGVDARPRGRAAPACGRASSTTASPATTRRRPASARGAASASAPTQQWDARDHRRSVTGEYLMLVEPADDLEVTCATAGTPTPTSSTRARRVRARRPHRLARRAAGAARTASTARRRRAPRA